MVATRRSGGGTAPVTHVPPRPSKRRRVVVKETTKQTRTSLSTLPAVSRLLQPSSNDTAQIRPHSESSEMALASPPPERTPQYGLPPVAGQNGPKIAKPSTEQIMAALKKLTTPGSSLNPIALLDNSPPHKGKQTRTGEPHRFLERYKTSADYGIPRPALVPRPAHGTTFTGHLSHDMYRMRTAMRAATSWDVSGARQTRPTLSFEMQYPIATRYLGSQSGTANPPVRPRVQHFPPPVPPYAYYAAPAPSNEGQLRSKAVQYVREHSRPSARKRRLAEDNDETSDPDSTEVNVDTAQNVPRFRPVASSSTSSKSGRMTIQPDIHPPLAPPTEQASLLTSLLQVYARSTDQAGLRADIALLAAALNQRLTDWLSSEANQPRSLASLHMSRGSRGAAIPPTQPTTAGELVKMEVKMEVKTEIEREKEKEQDREIRSLLSADAEVWQDGSGLSVADVFSGDEGLMAGGGGERGSECVGEKEGMSGVGSGSVDVGSSGGDVVVARSGVVRGAVSAAARRSGRKRVVPVRFRGEGSE